MYLEYKILGGIMTVMVKVIGTIFNCFFFHSLITQWFILIPIT